MSVPVGDAVVAHDFDTPGDDWPGGRHRGRDYRVPVGAPVRAARAGRVLEAGPEGTWGNRVVIASSGVHHYYAHLGEVTARAGALVETGELIGRAGDTGTTWPHLHYEERVAPYGELDQRRPVFDRPR